MGYTWIYIYTTNNLIIYIYLPMFIDFTQVNSGFDNTNELQPEACKSTAKLEKGDVNPKDSADKLGLSNNNRVLIR
jgi:hypothetical protein